MVTRKVPSSPSEWVMMAHILRDKGDMEGAIGASSEGLKRYPRSIDLLFTMGELSILHFNKAKDPKYIKNALVSFEKLLKINTAHYMANLLAGQIYLKAGHFEKSEGKADAILKGAPGDLRGRKLKELARQGIEGKKRPGGAGPGDVEVAGEVGTESLEGLESADTAELDGLITRLAHFSRLEGIKGMHIIDPAGVSVKSVTRSGEPMDELASFAADIYRTSSFCSRHIGLGNYQKGQIITPSANMVIVNVFYAILVLVLEPSADLNLVDARVKKYIEDLV